MKRLSLSLMALGLVATSCGLPAAGVDAADSAPALSSPLPVTASVETEPAAASAPDAIPAATVAPSGGDVEDAVATPTRPVGYALSVAEFAMSVVEAVQLAAAESTVEFATGTTPIPDAVQVIIVEQVKRGDHFVVGGWGGERLGEPDRFDIDGDL